MKVTVSLLRERFEINEKSDVNQSKKLSIQSLSTRIKLVLHHDKLAEETLIIRSKNMYSCVRMAAKVIYEYNARGPINNRPAPIDWLEHWDNSRSTYDTKFNNSPWVALYIKGKKIFSHGEHHTFIDVIEKCDALNTDYNESVALAENIFSQAGKTVRIDYESNMALISTIEENEAHCGMVLRGPFRATNFNFYVDPRSDKEKISPPQILTVAAAFLEGIELSVLIGKNSVKIQNNEIEKYSDDAKKTRDGRQRINTLETEINVFEKRYKVKYRPERPNFIELINEIQKKVKSQKPDKPYEDLSTPLVMDDIKKT